MNPHCHLWWSLLKKIQLFLILITIISISLTQISASSTIASYNGVAEEEPVQVVNFEMQVLYNNEYTNINLLPKTGAYVGIQNNTEVRFIATILNLEQDILLKRMEILIYNSSVSNNPENIYDIEYSEDPVQELKLEARESKTESIETTFHYTASENIYKLHCRFVYKAASGGNETLAKSPNNVTVSTLNPPAAPLDIIIWGMIFSMGTVIFLIVIGYLGEKRSFYLNKRKK